MKSSHDPNLTSWALNELSPAERTAFEDEIKKNPPLKAEAETTQNFCRFIQNHLLDERAALTDSQRARLKSAASATTRQIRGDGNPHGNVIQAKSRQWWQRPAFVLPLSAAAAMMLGFLPYLGRNVFTDQSSAETAAAMAATATPKPELRRSVLSPAASGEQSANIVALQIDAVQAGKPLADVAAQSTSTRHESLEVSVGELMAGASGEAKNMKTGVSAVLLEGNASENGAVLTNGVATFAKISNGGALTLTGINTYTGGLAVNGGVLLVGLSNAPASLGKAGESTTTSGTVTARAGRLNRATSGTISELGDLSNISEKANIMVNGGVLPHKR